MFCILGGINPALFYYKKRTCMIMKSGLKPPRITELTGILTIYMDSEVTSRLNFYCEFFMFKK